MLVIALNVCVCPQAFAQNVLSKADVIQATGDAVCIFKELQCLTPRGRLEDQHLDTKQSLTDFLILVIHSDINMTQLLNLVEVFIQNALQFLK